MGSFAGPKIATSGLVLSVDAHNQKSISPLGCTGFSGAPQLIKNMVSSGDVINNTTGVKLDNLTFYTAFAIDYPEGSIGGDAAGRQGITPGFNVRTGTKLYDASRALHLWVWNNDTSSWVADSYFHGLRLAGHCYDNYSGSGITGTELALFVSDYNTIKNTFPNCTYIVSGGHRADTYNVTVRNIFTDLGMPSGYIDSDFIGAPEWILVGKPGLGIGKAYGWSYQNYPTDTAQVAHLNFGLPIHQGTNNYLGFNGSANYATISTFTNKPTSAITCEAWIRPTKATLSGTIRGGAISATNSMYLGIIDSIDGGLNHALHWANQTSNSRLYSWIGSVPNNGWSHIVGTYDGTTTRAYLNGVQVYSEAQSGTIPDATYYIGTYGQGIGDGVHDFHGSISLAKIYNRALTAAEVLQNFNAKRGRFGI